MLPVPPWVYARLLPFAGRLRFVQDMLLFLGILGNGACLGFLLLQPGFHAPGLLVQALAAIHAACALILWTLRLRRAAVASALVAAAVVLLNRLA
jgi:hypothetical protein